jgi:ABC-type nitrate/sulfonate/bicarbonate transport system substrate-binding protein
MSRAVDAVAVYRTSGLYPLDRKGVAYTLLEPEDYGVHLYDDILITSRASHTTHEDLAERFMAATRKGWEYSFANVDEAVEITYPWTSGVYRDKEYLTYILEHAKPFMISEDSRTPIGYMSPNIWDEMYELYFKHKLIGKLEIYRHIIPRYFFTQ